MPAFGVLEPAIDPNNNPSFLLDWELTMKCNLSCTYCGEGIYAGHDNSTQHPALDDCVKSIDFMFAYVDLYMQKKPAGLRKVILNVYGGESLHHPNIVEILSQLNFRYKSYAHKWHLTVTTTTNAIITRKKLAGIIPFIDEFTVSYHTENSDKQKTLFKENLLAIKDANKRMKCIVLMHNKSEEFADAQSMIDWLNINDIKVLPKQLDNAEPGNKGANRSYTQTQVKWFNKLYDSTTNDANAVTIQTEQEQINLSDTGRACCGGRQLCQDQNYKNRQFYILDNKFSDWYCSVNHFFLYIKQVNGEIFVNKDCKMNFDGQVAPIGNLNNTELLLKNTARQLATDSLPIIQCKKSRCLCGLCAPKAQNLDTYKTIMSKYMKDYQL